MKKIYFFVVMGLTFLLLLGCQGAEKSEIQNETFLDGRTYEELTDEDWERINLSKREFNLLLAGLVNQYKEMETPLESAEMFGNRIVLTIKNSDGQTIANREFAHLLDRIVRRFYKHSEYNDGKEPIVEIRDQHGEKIITNNSSNNQ